MEDEEVEREESSRGDDPRRVWTRNLASAIGYAILFAHMGLLVVAAAGWPSSSLQSQHAWANAQLKSMPFTLFFAGTFLWMGELIRRQKTPQTSYKNRYYEAWLPRTTHLRMLALRWHVLWSVLAAIAAGVMLWLIWLDPNAPGWASVAFNAVLLAAIAGAFIASGFKKRTWLRTGKAQQRELKDTFYLTPERNRHLKRAKFWSWFSARFCVDNWCVGVGFALWWLAAWLGLATGTSEELAGGALIAVVTLAVVGTGLAIFGLWATTQFYRSGMDLETGEYQG